MHSYKGVALPSSTFVLPQGLLASSHKSSSVSDESPLSPWILASFFLTVVACRSFLKLKRSFREAERFTVARNREAQVLNDYLLQGVQGLILTCHVAADNLTEEHPSRRLMDRALRDADELILVGRRRLEGVNHSSRNKLDDNR